jgi:hypothetical protein
MIGVAMKRKEDPRFVTGAGCFTDDIATNGQAYAAVVRSAHARARGRRSEDGSIRDRLGLWMRRTRRLFSDAPGTLWPPWNKSTGPASSRAAAPPPPSRSPGCSGSTCVGSALTGPPTPSGARIWPTTSPSRARSITPPVRSARSPLAEVLADLGRAFAAIAVRWYLFGAQAAILYGAARLSADVDVTVALGNRPVAELVTALEACGFEARVPEPAAFAETTRVLPVVHRPTRMPADVILAGPGLEERFLAHAEARTIEDVVVPVASAPDLVVMKVLAGRPQDLEDATAVLRAQGDRLDADRARAMLSELERALDRRDLVAALDCALTRARRT